MQTSSVCFVFVLLLSFASCLHLPIPATFSAPSLPPSTGWARVQTIKPASQVITWRLSNKGAADSNEERNIKERRRVCSDGSPTQETQRRSESPRSCGEAATTLSLPFLHKYHQCRQQRRTCPGSPERVDLYHTARLAVISCYPWWWLPCNCNGRGSALLSDLAEVLPAARLSKGQRSEMPESKCAPKLSRVLRSPGASLLLFHLDFMVFCFFGLFF